MPAFKSFNFFIGANNAGKSTILNFISRHLPPRLRGRVQLSTREPYEVSDLERHDGQVSRPIEMAIGFSVHDALDALKKTHPTVLKNANHGENLAKVVHWLAVDGMFWKGGTVPYAEALTIERREPSQAAVLMQYHEWQQLWTALTNRSGGDLKAHWIPEVFNAIESALDIHSPPSVLYQPFDK